MRMSQLPAVEIASAVTEDGGIAPLGDGRAQWYMPEDLKRFRAITTENKTSMAIASGTFQAMRAEGYSLFSSRHNIVIHDSSEDIVLPPGHDSAPDIRAAFDAAIGNQSSTVFLIGDSQFYHSAFRYVSRLHLTVVQGAYVVNERFPTYLDSFDLVKEEPLFTEVTGISYIFREYRRHRDAFIQE